jgi:RNA polymerase sigma factor (sigma-70 family)
MHSSNEPGTRVTLLGRLRTAPSDPVAWGDFVEWYSRNILSWCRIWGLQESDAQDVTQEVFTTLSQKMREFQYDPERSFRAWLKTITHHAWRDYVTKQQKAIRGTGSESALGRLLAVEDPVDLSCWIDQAADVELLKEASARVQLRVAPQTWQVFCMLAIEQRSGAEVGELLGMKVATVFVARSKVQRMLREELQRLDSE